MNGPNGYTLPYCRGCARGASVVWRGINYCGACALVFVWDRAVTHYGAHAYAARDVIAQRDRMRYAARMAARDRSIRRGSRERLT